MLLLVYTGAHPPAFLKEDLKDVIIFPKHQSASQTYVISANLQTYMAFFGMAGFRNSPCNSFLTHVTGQRLLVAKDISDQRRLFKMYK